MKKAYAFGKITKDRINKRGYSKFLKIENDAAVSINKDKLPKCLTPGCVAKESLQPQDAAVTSLTVGFIAIITEESIPFSKLFQSQAVQTD